VRVLRVFWLRVWAERVGEWERGRVGEGGTDFLSPSPTLPLSHSFIEMHGPGVFDQ